MPGDIALPLLGEKYFHTLQHSRRTVGFKILTLPNTAWGLNLAKIFRHASVSSTYPCKLVGWLVGPSVRPLVGHTFGFPISGQ